MIHGVNDLIRNIIPINKQVGGGVFFRRKEKPVSLKTLGSFQRKTFQKYQQTSKLRLFLCQQNDSGTPFTPLPGSSKQNSPICYISRHFSDSVRDSNIFNQSFNYWKLSCAKNSNHRINQSQL